MLKLWNFELCRIYISLVFLSFEILNLQMLKLCNFAIFNCLNAKMLKSIWNVGMLKCENLKKTKEKLYKKQRFKILKKQKKQITI